MTTKNPKLKDEGRPLPTSRRSFNFCILRSGSESENKGFTPVPNLNLPTDGNRRGCLSTERGFTLLETVVALAIITAAVVGPVVLITHGLLSFGFAKNKLIAINLAQEGLELARLIRENNILCDRLSSSGPIDWFRDTSGGSSVIENEHLELDIEGTKKLKGCDPSNIFSPKTPIYAATKLRLNPASGIYSYGGGQETIFTREIWIKKPSNDENFSGGGTINKKDIREITSTVRWKERGMDREMVLKEKLYNWK